MFFSPKMHRCQLFSTHYNMRVNHILLFSFWRRLTSRHTQAARNVAAKQSGQYTIINPRIRRQTTLFTTPIISAAAQVPPHSDNALPTHHNSSPLSLPGLFFSTRTRSSATPSFLRCQPISTNSPDSGDEVLCSKPKEDPKVLCLEQMQPEVLCSKQMDPKLQCSNQMDPEVLCPEQMMQPEVHMMLHGDGYDPKPVASWRRCELIRASRRGEFRPMAADMVAEIRPLPESVRSSLPGCKRFQPRQIANWNEMLAWDGKLVSGVVDKTSARTRTRVKPGRVVHKFDSLCALATSKAGRVVLVQHRELNHVFFALCCETNHKVYTELLNMYERRWFAVSSSYGKKV